MVEVTVTVEIDRRPLDVFVFLADASNNPRWQRGTVACRWTSPLPVGVGATYEQEARFLGRTTRSTFAVQAFEPGRCITVATTAGSFPITVTRRVAPLPDRRTLVTAEVAGEPGGFFALATPLLAASVRRSVEGDHARLKQLLEAGIGPS